MPRPTEPLPVPRTPSLKFPPHPPEKRPRRSPGGREARLRPALATPPTRPREICLELDPPPTVSPQLPALVALVTRAGSPERNQKDRKGIPGLPFHIRQGRDPPPARSACPDAPRCLQLQEDVWEQTQKLSLPDKQDKETQTGSWPVWSRNGLRDDKKFCSVQIAHLVPTKPWGPRKIRHPLFTSPLLKSPFIKTLTFLPQLGDLLRIPLCNGDLFFPFAY
nr:uncharacterized protein LOC129481684 [Symphalangus syndactylus]